MRMMGIGDGDFLVVCEKVVSLISCMEGWFLILRLSSERRLIVLLRLEFSNISSSG